MSDIDRRRRPISQALLDAAQLVWPRVLYLTERELKDTAWAAEILDRAVCVVSNIMYRKGPQERILDPESYLYWAAARILYRTVEREKMIQVIDDVEPVTVLKKGRYRDSLTGSRKKLLIKQVMRYMDTRTRRMFVLRVKGYSWAEVGKFLGITANNAAVHYNSGIERARQRILRGKTAKTKQAADGVR
jgi:DNA-directed RNA polymerase specialized sigma24 family protein